MTEPTAPPLAPGVVQAVARRPDLWPTAVVVGLRLAVPGWWRRWPPRPWPSASYARFRFETMYGQTPGAGLTAADAIGYLEWCRRQPGHRR